MSLSWVLNFVYSQLFKTLPYPTDSYEGKTVIVTGSNVGLGRPFIEKPRFTIN